MKRKAVKSSAQKAYWKASLKQHPVYVEHWESDLWLLADPYVVAVLTLDDISSLLDHLNIRHLITATGAVLLDYGVPKTLSRPWIAPTFDAAVREAEDDAEPMVLLGDPRTGTVTLVLDAKAYLVPVRSDLLRAIGAEEGEGFEGFGFRSISPRKAVTVLRDGRIAGAVMPMDSVLFLDPLLARILGWFAPGGTPDAQ